MHGIKSLGIWRRCCFPKATRMPCSSLSSCTSLQNLPPRRGAASGMGDSTSSRRLPHCQEAQVWKGSATLQLDGEAEVATAWVAKSW